MLILQIIPTKYYFRLQRHNETASGTARASARERRTQHGANSHRRKEAADSNLFEEAYDKVVKGAEGICVKAVCDREELDLVSPSSERSSAGFDNSDLPVQADEPPELAAAVQQENCGGESPDPETDSTVSESEEPQTPPAAWTWQQQRKQQGMYASPTHSHDRSVMMGGMA